MSMAETAAGSPWPLDQIQGFLLRGYHMPFARHFALSVADLAAARVLIAGLTDPSQALRITSAMPWAKQRPEYCLNVGFTYAGLIEFGISDDDQNVLQNERHYIPFAKGAKARAAILHESKDADPKWDLDDSRFHVLLSIWARSEAVLEQKTDELRGRLAAGFAPLTEHTVWTSQDLDDEMVYFGYRDGVAQPIIRGSPFRRAPDGGQDLVDPSAFMIGTGEGDGLYGAKRFSVDRYGCFGAFMVIRQDVELFEAQVKRLAPEIGQALAITDPAVQELAVKATFCGRWPNGTPLTSFPIDGNKHPQSAPLSKDINNFRYGVGAAMDQGAVCPVSAHIRRANMRVNDGEDGGVFQGGPSSEHRTLRRAMPYQIPYLKEDRHAPHTERGLAGLFLGASLAYQFELVLGSWMNESFSTGTRSDPMTGIPDPCLVDFPGDDRQSISPVKSCVSIRVNAYMFYPGVEAVRAIASGVS
jgi:deferrochelatase/peroxidase EfeB